MTDDEINEAIAEACGFVGWQEFQPNKNGPKFRFWDYPKNWMGPSREPWVPKFCTDLNAMHEAEKAIFPYYGTVYSNKLARVTGAEMSDDTDYFCATARQRAEAFLRTLGKWRATDKESLTVGGATTEECSVDQKEVQK